MKKFRIREKSSITFWINGVKRNIEILANRTLLHVIRFDLGLTGTKQGCGIGECGACTVLLDGEPVNACLVMAAKAEGRKILTVEGLRSHKRLHPLQKTFIEHGAIQCGFCTPGILMAAKALIDRIPKPSRQEIKEALAGNFCRCSGYQQIIEAIEAVVEGNPHVSKI